MPLYECEQCHSVENTALTNFWDAFMYKKRALCSACDPEIGKWHDKFERIEIGDYHRRYPKEKIEYPAGSTANLASPPPPPEGSK